MKVIIDIDSDIMQKITNQYYGENEVDKTLVNELLMSLMHGISLNVIRNKIEARLDDITIPYDYEGYENGQVNELLWVLDILFNKE